jgi:isopentenyl diphosphate isomerase/L-lactate dehydrogenase-like FMN-dependent dehydrogenase
MAPVRIASVAHAQEIARLRLPASVYDYFVGGRGTGATVRANLDGFDRLAFRPDVAVHHPERVLGTTILGRSATMPVVVSPAGFIRLATPQAECKAAAAAQRAGIPVGISSFSSDPLDRIVGHAENVWFQLYMIGGRAGGEYMIDRAKRLGCTALVVTVDRPVTLAAESPGRPVPLRLGLRTMLDYWPEMAVRPAWALRFLQGGFNLDMPNLPPGAGGRPMSLAEAMVAVDRTPAVWADFGWIRRQWTGKLVIKGVMSAADARRAVDAGADAVAVSNHGGNALDGLPAAIDVLPEVVAAVGSEIEVLMDGGVRRGADVVRAVALGARAVLIGRAYIWGLAANGEAGANQVLELLRSGIDRTLALLGRRSIGDLDASCLRLPPPGG